MIFDGLHVVLSTQHGIEQPERDDYPYRLVARFSIPEFMAVANTFLNPGGEKIILQAKTRDVLEQFIAFNDLRQHPRLLELTITPEEETA